MQQVSRHPFNVGRCRLAVAVHPCRAAWLLLPPIQKSSSALQRSTVTAHFQWHVPARTTPDVHAHTIVHPSQCQSTSLATLFSHCHGLVLLASLANQSIQPTSPHQTCKLPLLGRVFGQQFFASPALVLLSDTFPPSFCSIPRLLTFAFPDPEAAGRSCFFPPSAPLVRTTRHCCLSSLSSEHPTPPATTSKPRTPIWSFTIEPAC